MDPRTEDVANFWLACQGLPPGAWSLDCGVWSFGLVNSENPPCPEPFDIDCEVQCSARGSGLGQNSPGSIRPSLFRFRLDSCVGMVAFSGLAWIEPPLVFTGVLWARGVSNKLYSATLHPQAETRPTPEDPNPASPSCWRFQVSWFPGFGFEHLVVSIRSPGHSCRVVTAARSIYAVPLWRC